MGPKIVLDSVGKKHIYDIVLPFCAILYVNNNFQFWNILALLRIIMTLYLYFAFKYEKQ